MIKKFIKHVNEALLEEQQSPRQKLKYLIGKIGTIDKGKGLVYIKNMDGDVLLYATYSIKIDNNSDIFVSVIDIEDNSDSVELLARLIRNFFSIISKEELVSIDDFVPVSQTPYIPKQFSVIYNQELEKAKNKVWGEYDNWKKDHAWNN